MEIRRIPYLRWMRLYLSPVHWLYLTEYLKQYVPGGDFD